MWRKRESWGDARGELRQEDVVPPGGPRRTSRIQSPALPHAAQIPPPDPASFSGGSWDEVGSFKKFVQDM